MRCGPGRYRRLMKCRLSRYMWGNNDRYMWGNNDMQFVRGYLGYSGGRVLDLIYRRCCFQRDHERCV